MKTVKYMLLVAFAAFFASCSDDTEVITVASKRACYCDFTGRVVPTFIYKTGNNDAWKTASEVLVWEKVKDFYEVEFQGVRGWVQEKFITCGFEETPALTADSTP